jgi:adenylylsulfate kinase
MSRGFILWFTGLSGAGKSTLATALATALAPRPIEILDGDEVRTHLSRGLSFSREDRDTNVHRIAFVARLLASHGVGVITAAISPYRDTRATIRALAVERGIEFVEVYANASIDSLIERDVKGLYAKALSGELAHFTGISDPYEAPLSPDVTAFTDRESVAESVTRIIDALRARGLVASRVDKAFDTSDASGRAGSN